VQTEKENLLVLILKSSRRQLLEKSLGENISNPK
jgi:hypothetical protein